MTNYRESMSQTLEHMYMVRERKILERELSDTELKRREEIAQEMDDDDFKDDTYATKKKRPCRGPPRTPRDLYSKNLQG